jgi:hypothetical protein
MSFNPNKIVSFDEITVRGVSCFRQFALVQSSGYRLRTELCVRSQECDSVDEAPNQPVNPAVERALRARLIHAQPVANAETLSDERREHVVNERQRLTLRVPHHSKPKEPDFIHSSYYDKPTPLEEAMESEEKPEPDSDD